MKFLVIEQDLRVSGTSQGIISRSFLAKLRTSYPKALIDVVYLKTNNSDDQLHLLPVDAIQTHILNTKVPLFTKWYNKIYWRLFHVSLNERYVQKVYSSYIEKIDYETYDHIFIRSSGINHETLLGAKDLPILKKAIVTFHEPYPILWCTGGTGDLINLELFRMKAMLKVVSQAKFGLATASLSREMEFLYGSHTEFFELPHQYDASVFDLTSHAHVFNKSKQVTICYHGAIQFGRDICKLLDVYKDLLDDNPLYGEQTEFILRLKKQGDIDFLNGKYKKSSNIKVLGPVDFSNSAYEQTHLADINVMLENGPLNCSVLLGKAPFLATINKPVFTVSPDRSDLRNIIKDNKYIASYSNPKEIKQKLEALIIDRLHTNAPHYPFGDYFSDAHFKQLLDQVLMASKA